MATIIEHHGTKQKFVLLGAGFGMYKPTKPHPLFGDFAQPKEEPTQELLCVCGANGEVGWVSSREVTVVSVDGKAPHQHLSTDGPFR